jgi:hypothetical protein
MIGPGSFRLEFNRFPIIIQLMSVSEIAELCEALPLDKRDEVADFARFLLSRQQEERWEALIGDVRSRPRLDAFLHDSAEEGDEALDLCRL